jgi:glycerol-3-phosphate cytidylyltransferase
MKRRIIITYGTFDLLHFGHLELLRRAKDLGDYLIVGLSTDEFNAIKGKTSHFSFEKRREMLSAVKYVDLIIPENNWEQKKTDIIKYKVDLFVMGADWEAKFDHLNSLCEVRYLTRTPIISSTSLKAILYSTA